MRKKPAKKAATVVRRKNEQAQHTHSSGKHNLDKRADQIMASPAAVGHDDDLLTTAEVADWLRISTQWLEIGRSNGNYGPRFKRLGPGVIRYKRASVLAWLKEREFSHTSQYKNRASVVEDAT
jgi:hypothetical protein